MHAQQSILICPVCSSALKETKQSYQCDNHHTFDKAKPDYVNLLLVQQKKSLHPGDDKAMVRSRFAFLSNDFYRPIATKITAVMAKNIAQAQGQDANIADIGCGIGYYLAQLKKNLVITQKNIHYWGIDVSKEAIQLASQKYPGIHWLVGNATKLPFADQAFNAIISVFSPFWSAEISRILNSQGIMLMITPTQDHLIELRQILFDEVFFKPDERYIAQLSNHFSLIECTPIQFSVQLQSSTDIEHLLRMTPFYWRTATAKRDQLSKLTHLNLTIAVNLWFFVNK